jgi:dolichol kinase
MTTGPSQIREISFGQELARKATHMGALIIPAGYYFLRLDRTQTLAIMIPITVAMILIDISRLRNWVFWRSFARKVIGPMVRRHEMGGDFTGATYILLSVCFTVALYDKPIAIAALAFIIVGDSFAAIIGRRFGRHRFRTKSVEGSLACLVGTIIVACLTPGLPLAIGLAGALVATIVEALSFNIDDNISVPIVSGLAMTLIARFVQNL